MLTLSLFVRLEAKPGKEEEVAAFLMQGLQLANQETTTPVWFALRLGPTTFAHLRRVPRRSGTAEPSERADRQGAHGAGPDLAGDAAGHRARWTCSAPSFPDRGVIGPFSQLQGLAGRARLVLG